LEFYSIKHDLTFGLKNKIYSNAPIMYSLIIGPLIGLGLEVHMGHGLGLRVDSLERVNETEFGLFGYLKNSKSFAQMVQKKELNFFLHPHIFFLQPISNLKI